MHNSIGFRKNDNNNNNNNKITVKPNNSLLNSNKKNENKYLANTNTKLLYEKIKKKTYANYLKKNEKSEKKLFKFSGSFKKRESLPQNKIDSTKYNKYNNNIGRKRKFTVKNANNLNLNLKYNNNITEREKERRHSINTTHRPILSLDDITTSYNQMKEKRNKIINKFKKEKISPKEQACYILSTSPILRLCEQLIFSNSSKNIKKTITTETILKNHIIFLNAKANELQNEISLCEKRINSPFVASKIADITLNFITSTDEQEFKDFDILELNKDEMNNYYSYIKLLYILFNENYEEKESGKILKNKLYDIVKTKGFIFLRDYLYHIYIDKKEEINVFTKIDVINNDIIKNAPNILKIPETLKICRFTAFTNYLVKEIIAYANNINDMFELKYRAQNLLDIVYEKLDKIEEKNKNLKNSEKK